eukprot:19730-Heterococcus_DN1.PRE.1
MLFITVGTACMPHSYKAVAARYCYCFCYYYYRYCCLLANTAIANAVIDTHNMFFPLFEQTFWSRLDSDGRLRAFEGMWMLTTAAERDDISEDLRHFFLEPLLRERRTSSSVSTASYVSSSDDDSSADDEGEGGRVPGDPG